MIFCTSLLCKFHLLVPTCGFYKICDFSQLTMKHKRTAKDDKHVSVISGTIKRDSNMPLPYTCNTQQKIGSCMFLSSLRRLLFTKCSIKSGLRESERNGQDKKLT